MREKKIIKKRQRYISRNAFLKGQQKMGNSWERSFNETKVLPVLFPIKTKEAYGNEQIVPLVKGVTSFFSRKDRGNLLIIV